MKSVGDEESSLSPLKCLRKHSSISNSFDVSLSLSFAWSDETPK